MRFNLDNILQSRLSFVKEVNLIKFTLPKFLLNNPQFLQARLDKTIPLYLRIFIIAVFYAAATVLFVLQSQLFKIPFVIFIILSVLEIYFYSRRFIFSPGGKSQVEIDYQLALALANCKTFSEAGIFESLLSDNEIKLLFEKIDLNIDIVKNQITLSREGFHDGELVNFFRACSLNSGKKVVRPFDVLFYIIKQSDAFLKFLGDSHLSLQDIALAISWFNYKKDYGKFNPFSISPIGVSWSAGYTPLLDDFSFEITKEATQNWHEILHQDLIQQVAMSIHNGRLPVLIGRVGSGRKSVIFSLIKKAQRGRLSEYLNYRRALDFQNEDFQAKFASTNNIAKAANAVFNEAAWAGNIFLMITDLDKTPEIVVSLNEFIGLKNFVAAASASLEKFEEILSNNKDFSSKVDKVFVRELKREEVLSVLIDYAWEKRINIPIQALKRILILAEKFDPYLNEPQRSINYLNETISYCAGSAIIREQDIERFFSFRFNVSLGQLKYEEKQKLLNIELLFHREMVDQEEAIAKITNALKSARLGLAENKKPAASFLFLGPTGVGKTTSAKVIAKVFFESDDFLVRLDMNEYSDAGAILRLISRDAGANSFMANIKKNALGVLLLDEIEKAHINVKNALLQMLDEGYLNDSLGEKTFVNNYVIIATSNAASEFIRGKITEIKNPSFYGKLKEHLLTQGIFTPEFLNRFDAVVAFKPLTQEDVINLTRMILKDFAAKIKEERSINISFNESFVLNLAQKGFSPEWGARELKRTVKNEVEPIISEKIISGELKEGDSIML